MIKRKDNSIIDYSSEQEGVLIPNVREIQSFRLNDVEWILVIEKEVHLMIVSNFHCTVLLIFSRPLSELWQPFNTGIHHSQGRALLLLYVFIVLHYVAI